MAKEMELILAVRMDDDKKVERLLKFKSQINFEYTAEDGDTALANALLNKNAEIIKALLGCKQSH